MKIINRVQNDLFGELLCFANDEEWAVVKRNKKDSPSYFYINPKKEVEFAQMDYR